MADNHGAAAAVIHYCLNRSYQVPDPEVLVLPGRKFRWDLAWKPLALGLEFQGGVWTGGRHTRGEGYSDDCLKLCLAVAAGWRPLWVPTHWLKSGKLWPILDSLLSGTAAGPGGEG